MRCFCPPDRLLAPCSMARSSSCDCARTKSLICAASSACHSSLSVASGLAISRLSRNVPAKRWLCAATMAISLVRDSMERSLIWYRCVELFPVFPDCSHIHPSYPERFPESSSTAVDLPDPEGPTMAVTCPRRAVKETPCNATTEPSSSFDMPVFPAPTTPDFPPICPVFPVSISVVTAVSAATLTAAAASVFTSTYRNDTSSKHTSTPLSEAPNSGISCIPCAGIGVSSNAKIRLVEVMPFIATWKNDPNWRSGMKKSAERSTISSTPASGNAAPLAYCQIDTPTPAAAPPYATTSMAVSERS